MRIVVWGTGITGIMTARVMMSRGHEVRLVDEKIPTSVPDIPVRLLAEEDLVWADLVIPSPGVPQHHPLLARAKKVLSEIEVAAGLLSGRLIAITGTNGKTTTTTLIHKILRAQGFDAGIGGNISPPLISLVEADPAYVVAEISSFQLEWIERFRPYISICMNITPDHLDRYRSMEEYTLYKLRIFENQAESDIAIINDDDPHLKDIPLKARRVVFSMHHPTVGDGAYVQNARIVFTGSFAGAGPRVPPPEKVGGGVIEDMLATALSGRLLGVSSEVMEEVFLSFKVIHHRFEFVEAIDGITFIDDSKATNVGALDKALSTLSSKVIIILGGKDKGGDFSDIAKRYRGAIRKAYVIGEATGRITGEIAGIVDCGAARDMEEAVHLAYGSASPGDVVLLSPGCASFDMFNSYAHRGEVFQECVRGLLKTEHAR
ncbi:MAG: UDP-N-acetylmuramoyl-L-alanine--D-glutamate ligase [Desulfobacterota bacterium]|nr:UDP-N-acetylmuramoyl-L-alanine--D-glutamate ligase [Thermodesulfobacteriota bacterium]